LNNTTVVENQKLQPEVAIPVRPTKRPPDYQQISLYKDVNPLDWEDWHWQLKNRIRTKDELAQVIKLLPKKKQG